jgi:type IV pilus assembly protein PilE
MRRNRGFTLLELLIVIGVVAILAALALPSYSEYIRKGKRGEGATALGDISLRQERYRADNPTYGTMDNLTGSAAATTTYNNQYKYYSVSIASNTATGYVATATRKGDLASDPKCGNLTITMASGVATKGMVGGVQTVDYCWRQ